MISSPFRYLYFFVFAVLLSTTGCKTMYYGAMEKMGVPKRDILVSRVEKARDAQDDAKVQFKDALEQFKSVVSVESGELEQKYDTLSKVLERSEARATEVRDRILAVENVSNALFKEWKEELAQFRNPNLRAESQIQYHKTLNRYNELIGAMNKAESKLEPVLIPLRDQVLFLKHNLNAKAIASLKQELISVESNVSLLVHDLEQAIAEANEFIDAMKKE